MSVSSGDPSLQRSPSGRAKCAICGEAIAKDRIRIVEQTPDPYRDRATTSYSHVECAIEITRHLALAAVMSSESPLDVLTDLAPLVDAELAALIRTTLERRAPRSPSSAPPLDGDDAIAALMTSLEGTPDDRTTLAVLGDRLIERGDVRGELIALQLEERPELTARRVELAAMLAPTLDRFERLTWGVGFLRRLELYLTNEQGEHVEATLAHPSAKLLTALELKMPGWRHELGGVDEIAPRTIRTLEVAGELAGVEALVAALPRLRRLVIRRCRGVAHPSVEWLELDEPSSCLPADLPSVRRLTLRVPRERLVERVGPWLGQITHLELLGVRLVPADVERLASELAGRRLAHLDVTGNQLPTTCHATLAACCEQLTFPDQALDTGVTWVEHLKNPSWGRGRVIRRIDDKLEIAFAIGTKVLKADAPFLRLIRE